MHWRTSQGREESVLRPPSRGIKELRKRTELFARSWILECGMNRSVYLHCVQYLDLRLRIGDRGERLTSRPSEQPAFRPPAVPLVTSNPYLSVWSMADRLTDDETRHWTRREHPLSSLIRIDGKTYRLMGKKPEQIPPLPQVGLRVLPTRTIYDFEGDHVHVRLTFLTPALPDDLPVLARPLTYLTWDVNSTGPEAHSISIFAAASARLAADPPGQAMSLVARGDRAAHRPSRRNGESARAPARRGRHEHRLGLSLPGRSHREVLPTRWARARHSRNGSPRKACCAPIASIGNRDSGTANGPDFAAGVRLRRIPGRRACRCRGTS